VRVFGNGMLKKIFGPKREEKSGEDYLRRSFVICTPQQIFG
jgi:hypothetical protein